MLLKLNPNVLHAMQNASYYVRLKASKLPMVVLFISCLLLFFRALSGAGLEPENMHAPPSHPDLDLALNNSAANVDLNEVLPPRPYRVQAHVDDLYQRWAAYLTCVSPGVPPTDSDSDGAEIAQVGAGGTNVITCLRERLAGAIRPAQNANVRNTVRSVKAKREATGEESNEEGIQHYRYRRMKRDEGLLRDIEYMTIAHGY